MYKSKYIKYKNKYLNLQEKLKLQIGGGPPIIQNIDLINRFTPGSEIEEYLNPIYGLYMYKSGYITNTFWLQEKEFNDSKKRKNLQVFNLSRYLDNKIQPNFNVRLLSSLDIGRYIALLYICKNNSAFLNPALTASGQYRFNLGEKVTKESSIDEKKLQEYASKSLVIKKEIPLNPIKPLELLDFCIILYCLWWILDNDNDIIQYYIGIKDILNIYNKYYPEKAFYINSDHKLNPDFDLGALPVVKRDSFEKVLMSITKENENNFYIFNSAYVDTFCKDIKGDPLTYSDCGEITGRNLINLICFDGNKFDIKKLEELGAIPELLEYYRVFSNFEEQSSGEKEIYGYKKKLNARDAWSMLILQNPAANKNINFSQRTRKDGIMVNYDIDSGMAVDNKVSNLFQLISNLLPLVTKWSDIKSLKIQDNTRNGIGLINIIDDKYNAYEIEAPSGHYTMKYISKKDKEISGDLIKQFSSTEFNPRQISIISFLLNKKHTLTEENYMWINYDTDNFSKYIDTTRDLQLLHIKLLELSFTNLINEDTRRRIDIRLEDDKYMYLIGKLFKTINPDLLNQYTYSSENLNFLNDIPLTKLTFKFIYNKYRYRSLPYLDRYLDLTPISKSKITSIGDNFLSYYNLSIIDLSGLIQITSIGNEFMIQCALVSIDLSGLINLTSIGNKFMSSNNLLNIDLSPLSKLVSIGDLFMSHSKLETVDLKSLSNLVSIGNNFLLMCTNLKSIDLSGLINITSIENDFLRGCNKMQSIDLSKLINLTSIGSFFLNQCTTISSIDLSKSINLTSIGERFLSSCTNIVSVDLSGLMYLTSIGDNFLFDCTKIQSIDFSGLINLESIGEDFLGYYDPFKNVVQIKCSAKIADLIRKSNYRLKLEEKSIGEYLITT
jgi:hypothetical protein